MGGLLAEEWQTAISVPDSSQELPYRVEALLEGEKADVVQTEHSTVRTEYDTFCACQCNVCTYIHLPVIAKRRCSDFRRPSLGNDGPG